MSEQLGQGLPGPHLHPGAGQYHSTLPGESQPPRDVETPLKDHRRDKHQPESAGPTNTRDNQMANGKHRNVTNRNQGNMVPSEINCPTTASTGYPNTPEKQDLDLKITAQDADRGLQKGHKQLP